MVRGFRRPASQMEVGCVGGGSPTPWLDGVFLQGLADVMVPAMKVAVAALGGGELQARWHCLCEFHRRAIGDPMWLRFSSGAVGSALEGGFEFKCCGPRLYG